MAEFIIFRVLGPIFLPLALFETYNFDRALPPDTTHHNTLRPLPFGGQDLVALLHFIDTFDCTAWLLLDPIDSKRVAKFADILCSDTPMTFSNTRFTHNVLRRFPHKYREEAKRRVLLMHENMRLVTQFQ